MIKRSEAQWRELFGEHARSGHGAATFCREKSCVRGILACGGSCWEAGRSRRPQYLWRQIFRRRLQEKLCLKQPILKSLALPEILAFAATGKYADCLPAVQRQAVFDRLDPCVASRHAGQLKSAIVLCA